MGIYVKDGEREDVLLIHLDQRLEEEGEKCRLFLFSFLIKFDESHEEKVKKRIV